MRRTSAIATLLLWATPLVERATVQAAEPPATAVPVHQTCFEVPDRGPAESGAACSGAPRSVLPSNVLLTYRCPPEKCAQDARPTSGRWFLLSVHYLSDSGGEWQSVRPPQSAWTRSVVFLGSKQAAQIRRAAGRKMPSHRLPEGLRDATAPLSQEQQDYLFDLVWSDASYDADYAFVIDPGSEKTFSEGDSVMAVWISDRDQRWGLTGSVQHGSAAPVPIIDASRIIIDGKPVQPENGARLRVRWYGVASSKELLHLFRDRDGAWISRNADGTPEPPEGAGPAPASAPSSGSTPAASSAPLASRHLPARIFPIASETYAFYHPGFKFGVTGPLLVLAGPTRAGASALDIVRGQGFDQSKGGTQGFNPLRSPNLAAGVYVDYMTRSRYRLLDLAFALAPAAAGLAIYSPPRRPDPMTPTMPMTGMASEESKKLPDLAHFWIGWDPVRLLSFTAALFNQDRLFEAALPFRNRIMIVRGWGPDPFFGVALTAWATDLLSVITKDVAPGD